MNIDFNQWVSNNNPSPESNYQKGFWDWVESVRRLSSLLRFGPLGKHEAELSVVGTITYQTPPPSEQITLPVVALKTDTFIAHMAWWFSVEPFLPSYLVAITDYRISDDDFYEFESLLAYETKQNEFEYPHTTNEQHVLRFFEKAGSRIALDSMAESCPPFNLDPSDLFYGNTSNKSAYSFDEFWQALKDKDPELFAKKPLLYTVWSYEGLYSSLSLINRISTPS